MIAPLSKNDAIRRIMSMTYSTRRACGDIKMPLYAHLALYMRIGVISTSYQRRARWNNVRRKTLHDARGGGGAGGWVGAVCVVVVEAVVCVGDGQRWVGGKVAR